MVRRWVVCCCLLLLVVFPCLPGSLPAGWPGLQVAFVRMPAEGDAPGALIILHTAGRQEEFIAFADDSYPARQYALDGELFLYRNRTEQGRGEPCYFLHRSGLADVAVDFFPGNRQPDSVTLCPGKALLAAGFDAVADRVSFLQLYSLKKQTGADVVITPVTPETGGKGIFQFAWSLNGSLLAVNTVLEESPWETALIFVDTNTHSVQKIPAGSQSQLLGYHPAAAGMPEGFADLQPAGPGIIDAAGRRKSVTIGTELLQDIAELRKEIIAYLPDKEELLLLENAEDTGTGKLWKISFTDSRRKPREILAAYPGRSSLLMTTDNRFCAFTTPDGKLYVVNPAEDKAVPVYRTDPGKSVLSLKAIGYSGTGCVNCACPCL